MSDGNLTLFVSRTW